MTSSFPSRSGQVFDRPVDTYVAEPSVLPKTGAEELATILQIVNPALQKFIGKKMADTSAKLQRDGMELVLGADNEELKNIIKQVKDRDGSIAARKLVGGNIFTQAGVERQLALNLGAVAEAKTKQFFEDYTVQKELPSGTIINLPLSSFDIASGEYQNALAEYRENNLTDTQGIRSSYVTEFIFPKQAAALQKILNNQTTRSAENKISNFEVGFEESVFSNYLKIDDYNEDIELNIIQNDGFIDGETHALKVIQKDMDTMVNLGLSESVSPSMMTEIIKKNANKIIAFYRDSGMSETQAMEEVDDFIDFVGQLKVGPRNVNKKGEVIQRDLKSFLDADNSIINMKKEIFKQLNDFQKEETEYAENAKQNDINNRLDQLDFASDDLEVIQNNARIIKGLKNDYKDEIDFVDTQVILRNFNVDGWFLNFQKRWVSGEFDGNKLAARTELNNFMISLGSSATKEDKGEFTRLDTLVKSQSGQGLLSQYPEIKGVIKFGEKVLSSKNQFGLDIMESGTEEKLYDLNFKFKKDVETVVVDSELSNQDKKIKIDALIKGYKEQIGNIKNNDYIFFDEDNNISGSKSNQFNKNSESNSNTNDNLLDSFNLSSLNTPDNQRIVSDVVNSLGATDGSLLAMATPTDTKQITIVGSEEPSGVKRFESNFPVFYKLAKDAGHKFPEVTAAQVMLETSGGATPSATNNYLGLKATQDEADRGESTLQNTTENENGEVVSIQDNFKNFNSLQDMMNQYKTQWNDDFMGRKGTVNVDTAEEAANLLQANVFATDPDYAKKIMQLIRDAKRNPPLF
jgi:flagellum-specific peptidoglycan hydrolase FlgJ